MGVTYLPPPPELCLDLMSELMALANDRQTGLNALVMGSILSFGFVFNHSFIDGNGRLSRFLFHKAACQDRRLASGLVLPVSIAMKRNESEYLQALQSFSSPARQFWQVSVENDEVRARFDGPEEIYRHWDATACVEFGLRMAAQALTRDLREESDFIHRFDRAWRAINDSVNIANNDLVILTRSLVQNKGALSNSRRKQFIAKGYTAENLSAAEQAASEVLIDESRSSERPEG